ncbi:STAS domain-containing protein [Bacillus solitudinis]|uniref:STAS domain-containing protein n=1 Tax=Bacillus solitudinis TaxID=2014074 RepID=UPI000C2360C7|nr:STAS domain-containing protein [Bacillus solitudinis]
MFSFSTEEISEHLEVKLEGDLDIEGTEVVEENLMPIMEKHSSVSVDFARVQFIDSSGMGLLLTLVKTLHEKEIIVTIKDVREDVMEVFELLQIPEILGEGVFV